MAAGELRGLPGGGSGVRVTRGRPWKATPRSPETPKPGPERGAVSNPEAPPPP